MDQSQQFYSQKRKGDRRNSLAEQGDRAVTCSTEFLQVLSSVSSAASAETPAHLQSSHPASTHTPRASPLFHKEGRSFLRMKNLSAEDFRKIQKVGNRLATKQSLGCPENVLRNDPWWSEKHPGGISKSPLWLNFLAVSSLPGSCRKIKWNNF